MTGKKKRPTKKKKRKKRGKKKGLPTPKFGLHMQNAYTLSNSTINTNVPKLSKLTVSSAHKIPILRVF